MLRPFKKFYHHKKQIACQAHEVENPADLGSKKEK